MPFFRFARMEDKPETHLWIEGTLEAERPWWDEEGNIMAPTNFREGLQEAERAGGTLVVHINSPGGDLTAGMAMFEMLRQCKIKTRCEITFAASAASLLPCGCIESLISPGGIVMIHKPSMTAWGDESDFQKAIQCYEAWWSAAVAAYQERVNKSEDEIREVMKNETYLNAQAAVEFGICDGILPKPAATAAMSYNRQTVMAAEMRSFQALQNNKAAADEQEKRAALLKWAQEN